MSKNVIRLSVFLILLSLYGCSATKDVEVRRYVEIKDRVDQDMEEGNAGYISGTPQPEDRSNIRMTRKIYVVEVSKGPGETEEEVVVESPDAASQETEFYEEDESGLRPDTMTETLDLGATGFDDEQVGQRAAPSPSGSSSMVEYTIQKDDTLQKISKKFYDSYSKWSKIYDANRAVISDPDRIKPGTVIQIPMDK